MWDTGQDDPVLAGETEVELPHSDADLAAYHLKCLNMKDWNSRESRDATINRLVVSY